MLMLEIFCFLGEGNNNALTFYYEHTLGIRYYLCSCLNIDLLIKLFLLLEVIITKKKNRA